MAIIRTVAEADATGAVAEHYRRDVATRGRVTTDTQAMLLNLPAYEAWEALIGAIARPLGMRRYELVTLAAAGALRSQACRLAHGVKSLALFDEQQLERIARDYHDADLTEAEVAIMEFAEKLSTDSSAMTEADSLRLRELGLSDEDIVNVALAAAARNYYSRALHALAVDVDVPDRLSPELRDALAGPIAS